MTNQTDDFKGRMINVKKLIPTPYISVYEFMFGEQNSEQRNKIRNVWNLRIVDKDILKNFETIAKQAK